MDNKIPILWKHDHTKPIGTVEAVGPELKFKFTDDVEITRENLFEIFGWAGVRLEEIEQRPDGTLLIKSGAILPFSFDPPRMQK